MSEWHECTLGDFLTLQRGFDLTEHETTPGPYPVISSGGVAYSTTVPRVQGPGVVTGRKGVLGKVHFSPGPYWPHDTTLWVKDFKGANPRFVYYFLQSLPLASLDAGASNPTLNRNHVHLLRVRVPDALTQVRIADVLGAIDDLIENNRRRVALLEQVTREIYREWFVRYRFPGHEAVPMVDSLLGPIPDGWAVVKLGDLADIRRGISWDRANETTAGGTPVVTIPNLRSHLELGGCTRLSQVTDTDRSRFQLCADDILLVGSNGNPERVGQAVRVPDGVEALFASFLMCVRVVDRRTDALLVYRQITDPEGLMSAVRVTAVGATSLRNLRISALRDAAVLVPDEDSLKAFRVASHPMYRLMDSLDAANDRLAEMRDLLLPKLVTGQIDISGLTIDRDIDEATT